MKTSRGGSNNREKFTEDFDFETSNAKFHKEEIEKELLKVLNKVKISEEEVCIDNIYIFLRSCSLDKPEF